MSEQDDKSKPDGWVASHCVEGFLLITAARTRTHAEDRLLERVFNFKFPDHHAMAEAYYAARDTELMRAANDGWRIRPVKLVFLDEVEK
jgi:hypothetical protein